MRRGTFLLFLLLIVLASSDMASSIAHASKIADTPPHLCTEQQVIAMLLKPGKLEIWNTATHVRENTAFDPRRYPSIIPHGKPLFTGADLDPKSLSIGQDQETGYYFINFSMKAAIAAKLNNFTSHNIGKYITITLDRVVVSSPRLQYMLHGQGRFQMSPRSLTLLGVKCAKV